MRRESAGPDQPSAPLRAPDHCDRPNQAPRGLFGFWTLPDPPTGRRPMVALDAGAGWDLALRAAIAPGAANAPFFGGCPAVHHKILWRW